MIYVSIDLETTGLNPETCDILEFGAVLDNLKEKLPLKELPTFHRYVYKSMYRGEPFALGLNGEIFKKIANLNEQDDGNKLTVPENLLAEFREWLLDHVGPPKDGQPINITVAGKNFNNFDKLFLDRLPQPEASFFRPPVKFHHRVLDPAVLYLDLESDRDCLPSTAECLKRAGIATEVTHTALEDAFLVVRLLRHKF